MSEHTKGPWHVSTSPDYFPSGATVIRVNEGIVVAVITKTPWHEANARLIAAAPELLEALEDAQRELALLNRNRDSAQADPERALIAIRAAIARATGAP